MQHPHSLHYRYRHRPLSLLLQPPPPPPRLPLMVHDASFQLLPPQRLVVGADLALLQ